MPHIELKITSNLMRRTDVSVLLQELVNRMSTFETVNPAAIKAYHVPIEHWVMGEGAPKGFAHCTVSVLSGRPMELKRQMAEGMVEVLRAAFRPDMRSGDASVTLELREMEADTYQK